MTEKTPVTKPEVLALLDAIAVFKTQAAFRHALSEQTGQTITSSHVFNWTQRKGGSGIPTNIAPDVEKISGIPCERLCPTTHWHIVRGQPMPRRRIRHGAKSSPPSMNSAGAAAA